MELWELPGCYIVRYVELSGSYSSVRCFMGGHTWIYGELHGCYSKLCGVTGCYIVRYMELSGSYSIVRCSIEGHISGYGELS